MKTIVALLVLCLVWSSTSGQPDAQRLNHFNVKKAVAIEGYDPVSYFDGKPAKGDPGIKFVHKAISYHFISKENLDRFKGNPERYEPAYGGWCAYAMGEKAEKVKIDPETFKITNGKLYLFYNFWGNNTLEDWNKDEQRLKKSGDENWRQIVK
jgi:hypothetical protein